MADVDRSMWDGRIPVAFTGARQELPVDAPQVDPFYMLVPRGVYLPLCAPKVVSHFLGLKGGDEAPLDDVWFEGQPLRWNFPVGLLYDVLCAATAPPGGAPALPWDIVVHFRSYPAKVLLPCPDLAAVETLFVNHVKESNYIRHGTVHAGLQSKEDLKQLWLGVANDDFEQFRRVADRLKVTDDGQLFKKVPFRLYPVAADGTWPLVLQDAVAMVDAASGGERTLADLLAWMLPNAAAPRGVLLQGIAPPPETPLQWLCEHCCYPDSFLHIVVLL